MRSCLVYTHLLKYNGMDVWSCGRNNYSKQILYLLKKRVKLIKIQYIEIKKHLTVFYKWIWCKIKDLIIFEEEDCS